MYIMCKEPLYGTSSDLCIFTEQRLSALLVSLLVGLSVLMSSLLRLVPMAVLFGVFLYMGISSINGIQFFERCRIFFMPVKHNHNVALVRSVNNDIILLLFNYILFIITRLFYYFYFLGTNFKIESI